VKPEDKLYWGRFAGGVLMGFLTAALKLYEPTILVGIALMIIAYLASTMVLTMILSDDLLERLGRGLYTTGAATYVVMWLIALIITFNLLRPV